MSAPNRSKTDTYHGLSIVLLVIFVSPIAVYYGPLLTLQDFSIYWYATMRWLEGRNPYELPDLASYVGGDFGTIDSNIDKLKVWAPPYFLCMMIPFAVLEIDFGKMLYMTCLLGSLAGWIWLTSRELAAEVVHGRWWDKYRHIAVALMVSPLCVTKSALIFGGMSVLAGIAFLILATTRTFAGFFRWALFWLLVSIKPHAVFGAAVAFMVLLPARERWRSLRALGTVGAIFGSILLVHSPHVVDQFLDLDTSLTRIYQPGTATFVARLLLSGMSVESSYLVSGSLWLISLLPLIRIRRYSMSFREIVAVALLFNVLSIYLSPYAWLHDYQSALGFLWATLVIGVRSGRLAVCNISLILALNVLQIAPWLYSGEGQSSASKYQFAYVAICVVAMWSCLNIVWKSNNTCPQREA